MSATSQEFAMNSVRGRRKQAKPQRKKVEAGEPDTAAEGTAKRQSGDMSPDNNHNLACTVKCEPESSGDEEVGLRELLGRTDTAVVFPEYLQGTHNSVPLSKERVSPEDDCFIKCTFCGQGLPSFQVLKEHMDANHPGGAFPCVHCAATFPSRDQLDRHEQLHNTSVQVSCKVCNKTFANVYRLQRHMISHDESAVLRKFKCPECDKAFKFKHHLKEHIRIHSGEKPFKCTNCGKCFSHSGSYSSHMTSKKCLIMNLKVNQRGLNRALELKHSPAIRGQSSAQAMKQSPTHNNNNFPPILPKYNEALFPNFPPQGVAAGLPFFFPPFNPAQHPTYNLHTSLNNLLEHFNKNSSPAINRREDNIKVEEEQEEGGTEDVMIKQEIQEEVKETDECKSPILPDSERPASGLNCKGTDLEEVNRILETVNAKVTDHFFRENMQKLSPARSSSGCPSEESGEASLSIEGRSDTILCKYCQKAFTSGIELHQHERYLCNGSEDKSEGLGAKLEDIAKKSEANGVSCSGSEDETRGSRDLMTEDEDGDAVDQDGRKVRVRSQISEDQLVILKQNYALNPRPKREELSRIADHVGLAVRVVQVWFQNNRARDRREGRLVHIPYVPQTSWYPAGSPLASAEQPLDLSTKKSQESSPTDSPPRLDSEEAVNLIQQPQIFVRPLFQQRSPSPTIDTSRLARILTLPHGRFPSNGCSLAPSPMFYSSGEQSASRSPVPAVAVYNGNANPNSASEWWKRSLMESHEADEFVNPDDFSKRFKLSAEVDSDGQLYSCDQCEKAFSKQSSLARHIYEHSGQRPHKCEICGKAFKHKHHLTEHKRLHSGERPFQCPKCLKRFSHSGSYSQHMNHRFSYCKPYRE